MESNDQPKRRSVRSRYLLSKLKLVILISDRNSLMMLHGPAMRALQAVSLQ
ncbi:unnamed protein product, partial [Nesidiocoris tenuis]